MEQRVEVSPDLKPPPANSPVHGLLVARCFDRAGEGVDGLWQNRVLVRSSTAKCGLYSDLGFFLIMIGKLKI